MEEDFDSKLYKRLSNVYFIPAEFIFTYGYAQYRKNEWGLNHYFIIYLVAFAPFSIYLPFEYLEEMLCLVVILLLQVDFKMENVGDLLS